MDKVKFAFEDLKAYNKALDLVDLAYDTSSNFPKQEMYGLISQLNRAAVSIALNIAEGSGDTDLQFNRFLQIVSNSIKECVVCSTIAKRRNYITIEEDNEIRKKPEELSKMISGLQNILKVNYLGASPRGIRKEKTLEFRGKPWSIKSRLSSKSTK